ncbi:hypothetical protein [Oscillibacter sp.]|uniref:hypothetical protein n=1 Tax=Oscillibacter sp. TaxID=1945593 RepID=UPI00289D79C6|nr:hypothetical protein [Oscillibacter sp.]
MERHERGRLALILPTHNRPACIRAYLARQAGNLERFSIDLILYDSSDGDETACIAEEYRGLTGDRLRYVRYTPQPGHPRDIDHKVYSASARFCGEYDYLWFSSDGTIMKLETLALPLFSLLEQGCTWVVLDNLACPPRKTALYTDAPTLLRECGWFMTMLGSSVLAAPLAAWAVAAYPVSPDEPFWLWQPCAYLRLLANEPLHAAHLTGVVPYEVNPAREDSFWKLEGNALWQWAQVWPEAVTGLPAAYDPVKKQVLLDYDAHIHLFSPKSLLSMKEYGGLTVGAVKQYRENLPLVTRTGLGWFYLIALFGNPQIIRIAKRIYHQFKKKNGGQIP